MIKKSLTILFLIAVTMNSGACRRSGKTFQAGEAKAKKQQDSESSNEKKDGAYKYEDGQVLLKDEARCFDANKKILPNQFVDQTQNTIDQILDCYDATGKLIYKGNVSASSCLEELRVRYGNSLIYPIQNLLPKLYAQATQQPAGQQEIWLVQKLSSASCDDLAR